MLGDVSHTAVTLSSGASVLGALGAAVGAILGAGVGEPGGATDDAHHSEAAPARDVGAAKLAADAFKLQEVHNGQSSTGLALAAVLQRVALTAIPRKRSQKALFTLTGLGLAHYNKRKKSNKPKGAPDGPLRTSQPSQRRDL